MGLKENGGRQVFPAWYKQEMVFSENGGYHTEPKLKNIPRIFENPQLQIKFSEFLQKCDDERTLVAYDDLIVDLQTGVVSINGDWFSYCDPNNFYIFEDGSIRWCSK